MDKKNRPLVDARIFNSGELVPKSKVCYQILPGMYVLQNTMVFCCGDVSGRVWGGEGDEKGERKTAENYIQNREKALKLHLFGFAPPAASLIKRHDVKFDEII